jgi:hypothetical protein
LSTRPRRTVLFQLALGLSFVCAAMGQTAFQADFNAGSPPLSSEVPLGNNLSYNFATSNVRLSIPIITKAGKIPFSYVLVDNAHISQSISYGTDPYAWGIYSGFTPAVTPSFLNDQFATIFPTLSVSKIDNAPGSGPCVWSFIDGNGTAHPFPGVPPNGPRGCLASTFTSPPVSIDGSGYTLNTQGVIDKAGNVAYWENYQYGSIGCEPIPESGTNTFTDPDLVQLTDSFSYAYNPPNTCQYYGQTDVYQDTMSSTPILTAYQGYPTNPPAPYESTYTYTDATGALQYYVAKYQAYTLQTSFGCSGVQDLQGGANGTYLPYEVDLPANKGSYTIQYESQVSGTVTGRISQVTNPTGGSVSFIYSGGNNGIQCSSAVVPTTQVTVNDNNGHTGTWTYKNHNTNSGPGFFYVAVTDPNGNQTLHSFSGTTNTAKYLGGVFPTEVQSYQGSAPANPTDLNTGQSAPNLLAVSKVCYNSVFTNCFAPTTAVTYPIVQMDVYKYPVIGTTLQSPSLSETVFDHNSSTGVTYGNVVSTGKWDFGATFPPSNNTVSTTTTTYGTWNGATCASVSLTILNTPCEMQVGNLIGGVLGNITQHKRYVYDTAGHLTVAYDYPGSTTIPPGQGWQSNTYYSLDGVVIASAGNGGDLWQVSTPGAGGSTEPFSSGHSVGYTVSDNQVTWTLIQTSASLTWQPHTQYDPNRQVNGKAVGQYIVGGPVASLAKYLFKLQPTSIATIIQQPAIPQPNTSTGDYVNLYYFDTSANSNPGVWTYNGTNYTTSNLASQAEDHQKVNSVLFNIGGDPDTQPMENFVLNQAGEVTGYGAPSTVATNHYSMAALFSLSVPTAGLYQIVINHDDGMLFGIDNGASLVLGINQSYETTTAMNGYPVIGGFNTNSVFLDIYVVAFPTPGQYDVEIDYFQWETEQTLTFQMGQFAPIPVANGTDLESMSSAPVWPVWTVAFAPGYATVGERGSYSAPAGLYTPTGGGLDWENHGPTTDFIWEPNENFTLPNTIITDPTGNKQAPFRTGYSGTSTPPFAFIVNQLTNDGPSLTWINRGAGLALATTYVYNPSGVLSQITDAAGNTTSYSNFICGGILPQTVTMPADAAGQQLATNIAWNSCNTAILQSLTDANNNTQTWTYNDPLMRPTAFTNRDGTVTATTYTTNTVETVTNFNGGSTTITSTGAHAPQTGTCLGPFPSFACDTESFGSWVNPQNVGSTTNAATVLTDQYDSSQTVISTQVTGTAPNQVLTVTMSNPLPNSFGVGSWAQVQGTQETSVNNSGYVYQVQSVSGATFTAAVCASGEPSCPTITNYSNTSDIGLVRFNNWFSWSLNATNFGFSLPALSTISGISLSANVTTNCSAGACKTGLANGKSAPYLTIGLITCPTCSIGATKSLSIPISGTTPVNLGGQNDLWGTSPLTSDAGAVNSTSFGVSIAVVQPDLGGGPDGQMSWSINSLTLTVTYQAAATTVSTNDVLTYLDGFGRTFLTQSREGVGSSNWDTTESDYNVLGQVVRSTLPFVSTKGTTNSSAPGTTYQYDAMNRMISATDSENPTPGQVTYVYNGQDVLVTLSPAPNGEHLKIKQTEYDGLDRLKSVCEVTQGYGIWAGTSCAQANTENGYLTSYTYDSSKRLTNVVMNANSVPNVATITGTSITNNVLTVNANNNFQAGAPIILNLTQESFLNGQTVIVLPTGLSATQFEAAFTAGNYNNPSDSGTATFQTRQSRHVVFDELGRITTLQDAESATSTFVYDATSQPCPAYFSAGDLVQKMDAVGNTTCYTYDSMHRVTSSNTVSGAYANVTLGKFFVYDSSSTPDPSGSPVYATTINGAGKVAAAYTCNGLCPTSGISPGLSVVDTEVYSYDALQRPITLYQSTTHGAPFMIASESYFPNGEINSLGLTTQNTSYPGTSTFFYSLDGMGRVNNLTSFINGASNGIATITSYYPATSLPTSISYFDGDGDSYSYDPNTLRVSAFAFTIPGSNGGAWSGQPTWNPNGSLGQLVLSNTIPGTNIASFPTCNYQYDDLLRMNSEQCTPGYSSSTLSFDPFGNPSNTTQQGHTTWYQPMTFNPQNNQITSFPGCGGCMGPYHDANGNQIVPVTGGSYTWDAYNNLLTGEGGSRYYDPFDRLVSSGSGFGSNYAFYRPDGTFYLRTGNTWFGYWGIDQLRLPMPGGSDVEVTQQCSSCSGTSSYAFVYAIRHADYRGSHVFGSCADLYEVGAPNPVCTYNTYYFGHISDAFGNVEATVNCGFGCNSNHEPGSFDAALGEFGYDWDFPTRTYRTSEQRFFHPEGHRNVDLSDPQSWHSYAYARNNPLALRDPMGTQYDNQNQLDQPTDPDGTNGDTDNSNSFTTGICAGPGCPSTSNNPADTMMLPPILLTVLNYPPVFPSLAESALPYVDLPLIDTGYNTLQGYMMGGLASAGVGFVTSAVAPAITTQSLSTATGLFQAGEAAGTETSATIGGLNEATGQAGPSTIYSVRVMLRSAAKANDAFHNFPETFDQVIMNQGTRTVTTNFYNVPRAGLSNDAVMYEWPGSVNGTVGNFQIGTRPSVSGNTEIIMHRFFNAQRP